MKELEMAHKCVTRHTSHVTRHTSHVTQGNILIAVFTFLLSRAIGSGSSSIIIIVIIIIVIIRSSSSLYALGVASKRPNATKAAGLGFGVWGLGFGVWGLGFGI